MEGLSGAESEPFTLFDVDHLLGLGNSTADEGAIPVDVWTLARTSGLVVGVLIISTGLGLGQSQQIIIATLRALVQLSILGVILEPIFKYAQWWVVSLYVLFMATVAAQSAIGRPRYTYPGILWHMCLAAWTAPVAMTAVTVGLVLQADPVWEPQYAIPLAGMSLGNAVTAMSLSVDSLLKSLKEGRDKIELLLAAGASRSEACSEAVREAVTVAMTPTINNLTVIGLVSIPGMMTGQIIGGNSPAAAAKYQFIVLIMILAACVLSAIVVSLLAVRALVTTEGFVLADSITRQPTAKDFLGGLRRGVACCCGHLYRTLCCCFVPRKRKAEDLQQPLTEDAA
mmetsp:Transcript_9437/g.21591  ORF Transcript_9437/g.21591 Transcript_9437/m.21591 type:complete len:341 (-) Transcript_9437:153-1175(-)